MIITIGSEFAWRVCYSMLYFIGSQHKLFTFGVDLIGYLAIIRKNLGSSKKEVVTMGRANEVDLRLELNRGQYAPGEVIKGTAKVHTTQSVKFKSANFIWQTQSRTTDGNSAIEYTKTLMSISQPIEDLDNKVLTGQVTVPIEFELPQDLPATIEMDLLDRISINTTLTVSLVMNEPLYTSIVRDYPIKIIKRDINQGRGILQTIEFPLKGCCMFTGIATAHIELLKTTFTVGDMVEATVVTDLTTSSLSIRGVAVAIKRTIRWKSNPASGNQNRKTGLYEDNSEISDISEGETEDDNIEEREMCESRLKGRFHRHRKTAVTVSTNIPKTSFVPDVDTDRVSIKHSALFLFYCGSYVVETEIPINLVHPEVMMPVIQEN